VQEFAASSAFGGPRGATVLHVKEVTKRYGTRTALKDVNLDFTLGVTALLGQNGAGKSTLIRALATVERPDAGQLTFGGKPVRGRRAILAYRRNLGWLPQQLTVPVSATLREYLEYVGWLKSLSRRRRKQAARTAADSVGLHDRLADPLSSLSGGMLRRAGLAPELLT